MIARGIRAQDQTLLIEPTEDGKVKVSIQNQYQYSEIVIEEEQIDDLLNQTMWVAQDLKKKREAIDKHKK